MADLTVKQRHLLVAAAFRPQPLEDVWARRVANELVSKGLGELRLERRDSRSSRGSLRIQTVRSFVINGAGCEAIEDLQLRLPTVVESDGRVRKIKVPCSRTGGRFEVCDSGVHDGSVVLRHLVPAPDTDPEHARKRRLRMLSEVRVDKGDLDDLIPALQRFAVLTGESFSRGISTSVAGVRRGRRS